MYKYKIICPLGKGSFGNVYKVKNFNAIDEENDKKKSKFLFISKPDNIYDYKNASKLPYKSSYKSPYQSSYKSPYKSPYQSPYKSPYNTPYKPSYKSSYKSSYNSQYPKNRLNSANYLKNHIKKNDTPIIKKETTYYAMKKISIKQTVDKNDKLHLLNEIRILAHNKCPFLLSMIDVFQDISYICLVTNYAKYGDFYSIIKKRSKYFDEELIWDYFIQTCLGIKYLHDNNIIHRDIKASNIFLDKRDRVIIGDFGICKVLKCEDELTSTSIGTPYYMSPELFKREEYSKKIDIWAVGCFLFELMAFKPPFSGYSMRQLSSAVRKERYCKNIDTLHYSKELRNIVKKILIKDMNIRPDITQILKFDDIKSRIESILKKHDLLNYNYEDNVISDFDTKFTSINYFLWDNIIDTVKKEIANDLLNKKHNFQNLNELPNVDLSKNLDNDLEIKNKKKHLDELVNKNLDNNLENKKIKKQHLDELPSVDFNKNNKLNTILEESKKNSIKIRDFKINSNKFNNKNYVLPKIKRNYYSNKKDRLSQLTNYDVNYIRYENKKKLTLNGLNQERYNLKNKNFITNSKNFY